MNEHEQYLKNGPLAKSKRKNILSDFSCSYSAVKGCIDINYIPKTDRAVYDICTLGGKILRTGEINGSGITSAKVDELSGEIYNVIVIDGDYMIRKQIITR